ncbi:MAG: 4-(cytidine 5'-diphospho)-2-C-methyl-D-erythritol kinase [Candidatus Hydrothermia bacterium]
MNQDIIKSYAKINLGLWITEKRPDGYHNIVTVFHKIGLHDIITVTPHHDFEVVTIGEEIETKNILFRVKELVEKNFGITITGRIEILKRIPVGSGLGGASSNAAYYLKYLNNKRNLGLSTKELVDLGKEIGSDVPFFLLNENAAIATGRGEILEPVRSTFNYPLILGFPDCRILTKWAYERFDELSSFTKFSEAYKKAVKIADALENNDISLLETEISNDFEKIVNTRCPEILDIKDILVSLGAQVAVMSGSGSAVFGIFERMPFLENFGEKLLPSSFLEMD